MKSLVVEGWRFCPNSFSVVNQYQLVQMLADPRITLYHRDLPYDAGWWKWERGLLPADQETAIENIPAPTDALAPDAVLRISHPYRLEPAPRAKRTFVFGTAELGIIEDLKMVGHAPARQLLPAAECFFVTTSRWSAEGFVKTGARRERIAVIPCGYDPAIFKPAPFAKRDEIRRKLGWEGKFVILNVSTMSWYKGLFPMLLASGIMAQRHRDVALAIKGSDSLWRMDDRLSGGLAQIPAEVSTALRPRITYLGKTLSNQQMAELYQAADVYLSPYHGEGFNIPVLEAAACGLPSIVTAGGPTDEFTTPEFALRIDSKTIASHPDLERSHGVGAIALTPVFENLLEHLEKVYSDAGYRAASYIAGPAYVAPRFTWKKVTQDLVGAMLADDPASHPAFNWSH